MATERKKTKPNKPGYAAQKPNTKENKGFSPEKEKQLVSLAANLAGPLCETQGMELVHVEYQREPQGRILRIYIDKPGGVKLDDCVCISRQLGDLLDVSIKDEIAYNLEVSSPGLDRPLGKESDYEKFKGKKVMIKISQPFEGKKRYQGILQGMSDGKVLLLVTDKTVSIPYGIVSRARLVNNNGEI